MMHNPNDIYATSHPLTPCPVPLVFTYCTSFEYPGMCSMFSSYKSYLHHAVSHSLH